MSARVDSVTHNELGGWYAYRASKAATNMLVKTIAIEARTRLPNWRVVALHPGTVQSALSEPFTRYRFHALTLSHTHTYSDTHTRSHTHSLTHSISLSHTQARTHAHSLMQARTHSCTHVLTDACAHWFTDSLTHSPSLPPSPTHSHSPKETKTYHQRDRVTQWCWRISVLSRRIWTQKCAFLDTWAMFWEFVDERYSKG